VLDRHARERGTAPPKRPRRRWRPRLLVPVAAAGTALVVVAALALAGVFAGGGERRYELALSAGPGAPAASGTAALRGVEAGMDVRLRARDLPPGGGAVYELWCVRGDGSWVSAGTFHAADGTADAHLTAAVRRGDYEGIVVTRRARDAREGARGETVLEGRITRN
jgi:hypothetical protein